MDFDMGFVAGQFIMAFAVFALIQFALSKMASLRQRLVVTVSIALVIALLILLGSSESVESTVIAAILLLGASYWRYKHLASK